MPNKFAQQVCTTSLPNKLRNVFASLSVTFAQQVCPSLSAQRAASPPRPRRCAKKLKAWAHFVSYHSYARITGRSAVNFREGSYNRHACIMSNPRIYCSAQNITLRTCNASGTWVFRGPEIESGKQIDRTARFGRKTKRCQGSVNAGAGLWVTK